jgi:hypothetical protein
MKRPLRIGVWRNSLSHVRSIPAAPKVRVDSRVKPDVSRLVVAAGFNRPRLVATR